MFSPEFRRSLKYALFVLILLTLATPLVTSDAISQGSLFLKSITFQALVECAFAVWILLAVAEPAYRPRWRHPMTLAVGAFLAMLVISLLFSVDPVQSFWSDRRRMMGVVNYLHFGAWFLILSSSFWAWAEWKNLWRVSCGVALVAGVIGIGQVLFGAEGRADSTLGNALYAASYFLLHVFIALSLFVRETSKPWRNAYLGSMAVFILAVLVTASRGAFLALGVGALISAIGLPLASSIRRNRKVAAAGAVAAAVVLGLSLLLVLRSAPMRAWGESNLPYFATRVIYSDVDSTRFEIWGNGWEGFLARPAFGWGLENFGLVFNKYFDPTEDTSIQETWYGKPHNLPLEFLVDTGAIGFAVWFAMWAVAAFVLLRAARRGKSQAVRLGAVAFLSLLAAHLVQSVFTMDMPASNVVVFALLACLVAETSAAPEVAVGRMRSRAFGYVLASLLFLAVLTTAWYANFLPLYQLIRNQQAQDIVLRGAGGTADEALQALEDSMRIPTFMTRDLCLRNVDFTSALIDVLAVESDFSRDVTELTAADADRYAAARPLDYKTQLAAARAHRYAATFDPSHLEKASAYAAKVLELGAMRSDGYEEAAEIARLEGRYEESLALFLKTRSLAVDMQIPSIDYRTALVYVSMHDFDAAKERLDAAVSGGYDASKQPRLLLTLAAETEPGEVPDWALDVFRQVSPFFPGHFGILRAGAVLYAKAGDAAMASIIVNMIRTMSASSADMVQAEIATYLPL